MTPVCSGQLGDALSAVASVTALRGVGPPLDRFAMFVVSWAIPMVSVWFLSLFPLLSDIPCSIAYDDCQQQVVKKVDEDP